MLSYETLDSIADSVNPALLVVTAAMPWMPGIKGKVPLGRWFAAMAWAVVITYGIMFLDAAIGIWKTWDGDYSTHSAAAISLVTLWFFASVAWFVAGLVVFLLYAALMVYQGYHSWGHILSTVIVAGPLMWAGCALLMGRRWRRQ